MIQLLSVSNTGLVKGRTGHVKERHKTIRTASLPDLQTDSGRIVSRAAIASQRVTGVSIDVTSRSSVLAPAWRSTITVFNSHGRSVTP